MLQELQHAFQRRFMVNDVETITDLSSNHRKIKNNKIQEHKYKDLHSSVQIGLRPRPPILTNLWI